MSKVAEVFDSLEYGPAPEAIDHANAWTTTGEPSVTS